jgi:hypothetical protein
MARQRASQVRDAFARVGTSPVASESASDIAADNDSVLASGKVIVIDGKTASALAGRDDGGQVGPGNGGKAGKPRRRVGRPRGPERVPLTVRVLAATDERLTAAVNLTGQSPQYLVDAALAAYFDALGV